MHFEDRGNKTCQGRGRRNQVQGRGRWRARQVGEVGLDKIVVSGRMHPPPRQPSPNPRDL